MSRAFSSAILGSLAAFCLILVTSCTTLHADGKPERARNVIVMIADGCGQGAVEAARTYSHGSAPDPLFADFTKYYMSTFSVEGSYDSAKAWGDFAYVQNGATDSAAAATTMATGVKTKNGYIGVDADKKPLRNILEDAEALGKSTGVVTSVPLSHATPAGFSAHADSRGEYEEIANQMLSETALDVIIGAGHPKFDNDGKPSDTKNKKAYRYVGGTETWAAIQAGTMGGDADGDGKPDPWTLVDTRAGLQRLAEGPAPKRLLGIAPVANTFQQGRGGEANAPAFAVPLLSTSPTLTEATQAALNVLDDNPKGFVVMIEGGAVDWAGHSNQPGRLIEEKVDFDKAVASVVAWVEKHGGWDETLLIVTADHETGYVTGAGEEGKYTEVENRGKGVMPGLRFNSKDHTNSLVPFFIRGAGAERAVAFADQTDERRGPYLDNTELPQIVRAALH